MRRYRALLTLAALLTSAPALAELERARDPGCNDILDRDERLDCYDAVFGKPELARDGADTAEQEPVDPDLLRSQRSREFAREWFAITAHRPNYFLPATYNANADFEVYEQLGAAEDDLKDAEIKFQISIRTLLWPEIFGTRASLSAAYTQQSYWQRYAEDISSPFREANHEPELLLDVPIERDLLGFRVRDVTLGLNHQSNGQSEPLSRSWNRLTGQVVLDRGRFTTLVRSWWRFPEDSDEDDNPDIERYMGQMEIGVGYRWQEQSVVALLKNNLRADNRSGLQIDWTFPLAQHLKGYVQLYTGYGENLIDGDSYTNRIGFGIMLSDWY